MAEEWISPSKRAGAGPSRLRVGQLRQQFETPQVQSSQQRAPPTRHNIPELRKKFERGKSNDQSVAESEQPHHDETEYVDILKSIVDHHKRDVASLQNEIEELEELVEDLSSDRLSSMRDPSESGTYDEEPARKFTSVPIRKGTNPSLHLDMMIHDLDVEDYYDSFYEDPWAHMPPSRNKAELEDDVFYPGGSPRGYKQQFPYEAANYELLTTGRHRSEDPKILNYPGTSHRKEARSQPSRKLEKDHAWPMRGRQKPFVTKRIAQSTYASEPSGEGTYATDWSADASEPSGKGSYTTGQSTGASEPSRKGTYTTGQSTDASEPSGKGTYTTEQSGKEKYAAGPSGKGTYTAETPGKASYTGSSTGQENSYDLDMRIHELDVEDYYDSFYENPWDYMPPSRNKNELEDDVFYPGGSPRGYRHQFPFSAAQYEMLSSGRHLSEIPDTLNYPGTSHRKEARSQPSRKLEKDHVWPMRGRQKPFVTKRPQKSTDASEPSGKGTYNAEPSRKGTYNAEPSRKGTYTTGQSGKEKYAAGPSGKGTYTTGQSGKKKYAAGPSRKGTYTTGQSGKEKYAAGPSRKGTYVAEPSRKETYTAQPARKGTYTAQPGGKGTHTAGPSGKGLQKTITLRSPGKNDPQPVNISVETRGISESASGEHVICDLNVDVNPKAGQSRKGTYAAEPSRKGTYTASSSSRQAQNKPFCGGTVNIEPHTPFSRTSRFHTGQGGNTFQKTITVRSPGRNDPQPVNISVETRGISESASGEHVVCDIHVQMKDPKSRQGKPSMDTPKGIFSKRRAPIKNLFDAELESPQYRSPKDNTIEWETAPMDRTFTPDHSIEGEDDDYQPQHNSSSQSQGNRTFSNSPPKIKLNDQTLQVSSENGNASFEASPHDRSFRESEDSPQYDDDAFEASPHDRSFRESEGDAELDSSYEDSPTSTQWKQRSSSQSDDEDSQSEDEDTQYQDETNGNQLDTTF